MSMNHSLEKAVQSLSETDAKAMLLQCARKDSEIAEQIMLKTAGRVTDRQIQEMFKEVSKITEKYGDRYGFIEYEYAGNYVDALDAFLGKEIPVLLNSGLPLKAFELTCRVIQEASEAEMDDSGGEVETIYYICEDYWRDIMAQMNREEQNKVFDWIQDNYTRWDASDMFFNPFLFGNSTYESAFQGEDFERRKLDFLDARIATAREGSYGMRTWTVLRLQTMEKLSMDTEEMERFARTHYQEQTVREWMIERAVQNGSYEEAIAILRDSKKMDEKIMGCVGKYSAKLVELYGKLGRTEDLREELTFQMEQVRQSDLRYVNQIKEMTPPEEWPELREKLLSLPNISGIRNRLLAQEGLYDRLLKSVQDGGFFLDMENYEDVLKDRYPQEVLEFYVNALRRGMAEASSRKEYAVQVNRLNTLKRLNGGREAIASLAQEWRAKYPRHRAMMDELNKGGFYSKRTKT